MEKAKDDNIPGVALKLRGEMVSNYWHSWPTTYMKLAVVQRLNWIYDDCPKEEAKSYKMQRQSHSQHHRTLEQRLEYIFEGKSRIFWI